MSHIIDQARTLKHALVALLGACIAAGCASVSGPGATHDQTQPAASLPDCLTHNYDAERRLFTVKNLRSNAPNQQCVLNVGAAGQPSANYLAAGRYLMSLSNGGDGGAGGTQQEASGGGGGGGGGGAGARELSQIVTLNEGAYRMTLGAGGPGGNACVQTSNFAFPGGPGWIGSPTSLVRMDSNQVLMGAASAEQFARPTRAQNESSAGSADGHGGSGFGKTRGGAGGHTDSTGFGGDSRASNVGGTANAGGSPGVVVSNLQQLASGGGGGSSRQAEGGDGGGELPSNWTMAPERGLLGSGGGGGEGTQTACGAGASGGNGFIALRAYVATQGTATGTVLR